MAGMGASNSRNALFGFLWSLLAYSVSCDKKKHEITSEVAAKPHKAIFAKGDAVASQCPVGYARISLESGCQSAASHYGFTFKGSENAAGWPKGCYQYNAVKGGKFYLNQHRTGSSNSEATPICQQVTCSGYTCGDGWTHNSSLASIACSAGRCTDVVCCDQVTCKGYSCGDGWKHKLGVASIPCSANTCIDAECCDQVTCSGYTCGDGKTNKSSLASIACSADRCTDAECCDQVTCSGYECGNGWTHKPSLASIGCSADRCTKDECCDQVTCSGYVCADGWILKSGSASITCSADTCGNAECCEQVTCSTYACGDGWTQKYGTASITCTADTCINECCDQVTCSGYKCGDGWTDKSGLASIGCSADTCADADCCDQVTCSGYTCGDGWTYKSGQANIFASIGCASDKCTDSDCCDKAPPMQSFGASGCKGANKCKVCAGDCDDDSDCESGLTCFQRDGYEAVPGCVSGGSGDLYGFDFCYAEKPMLAHPNSTPPSPLSPKAPTTDPAVREAKKALAEATKQAELARKAVQTSADELQTSKMSLAERSCNATFKAKEARLPKEVACALKYGRSPNSSLCWITRYTKFGRDLATKYNSAADDEECILAMEEDAAYCNGNHVAPAPCPTPMSGAHCNDGKLPAMCLGIPEPCDFPGLSTGDFSYYYELLHIVPVYFPVYHKQNNGTKDIEVLLRRFSGLTPSSMDRISPQTGRKLDVRRNMFTDALKKQQISREDPVVSETTTSTATTEAERTEIITISAGESFSLYQCGYRAVAKIKSLADYGIPAGSHASCQFGPVEVPVGDFDVDCDKLKCEVRSGPWNNESWLSLNQQWRSSCHTTPPCRDCKIVRPRFFVQSMMDVSAKMATDEKSGRRLRDFDPSYECAWTTESGKLMLATPAEGIAALSVGLYTKSDGAAGLYDEAAGVDGRKSLWLKAALVAGVIGMAVMVYALVPRMQRRATWRREEDARCRHECRREMTCVTGEPELAQSSGVEHPVGYLPEIEVAHDWSLIEIAGGDTPLLHQDPRSTRKARQHYSRGTTGGQHRPLEWTA